MVAWKKSNKNVGPGCSQSSKTNDSSFGENGAR